ncbi:small secreted protein [Streptomyces sp. NPDC092296]|uniref:small secreted protein n=1 Tax=Streptomyces sp. NPDC092296 TaxID=3366012 RepID=UPI00382E685B
MKIKLLALPVAGALLAFGAAACSDNSEQLDAWAKSVCDAAQDPIAQANSALADTGRVQQGESPAQLRKRLSGDIAVLGRANQQIAASVDKAGAPKVDGGAGLQQQAVAELGKAATGYQDVQRKVDALPTDDQARFADGLKSVGDQVQQLAELSSSAIAKLQTGDLGQAIAKQPGCRTASPSPGDPTAADSTPAGSGPAASEPAAGASTGPTATQKAPKTSKSPTTPADS